MSDSNSPPTTTTDAETSLAVDEGAAADWDVSEWFADPDTGDTLTYTLSDEPDWLELDDSNGELTIAAEATDDGDVDSHVFVITASDDDGEEATLTVTLTVENVNEAPVVATGMTAPPATVTAMEGGTAQALTVTTWFSDPDGDTLTFALAAGAPSWATFDAMTGVLSLAFNDTDDADVGSHTLAITATDPGKLAVTHSVTVAVSNVGRGPGDDRCRPGDANGDGGPCVQRGCHDLVHRRGRGRCAHVCGDSAGLARAGRSDGSADNCGRSNGRRPSRMHTLAVTASDKAGAMAVHTATLVITDTANEPSFVGTLSNRIVPVTGESLVLDLTGAFTDDDEEDEDAAAALHVRDFEFR